MYRTPPWSYQPKVHDDRETNQEMMVNLLGPNYEQIIKEADRMDNDPNEKDFVKNNALNPYHQRDPRITNQ